MLIEIHTPDGSGSVNILCNKCEEDFLRRFAQAFNLANTGMAQPFIEIRADESGGAE